MNLLTLEDVAYHIEDILKEEKFWDRDRRFTQLLEAVRVSSPMFPMMASTIIEALREMIKMSSTEEKCVIKPHDTEDLAHKIILMINHALSN